MNDITFIIRSIGERTEKYCKEIICQQGVAEDNIFIVNKTPFTEALKESYKIGIKQNKKWTFCIDADVLIRNGIKERFLSHTSNVKNNTFEIQALVLDKFTGGPRAAGNHLYRTEFLSIALNHIPSDTVLKPESYVINKMASIGYPYKEIPIIIGLHDYEQYYEDIHRKAFIFGRKFERRLELFVKYWKKHADDDHDYKVALYGLSDSMKYDGFASIDANRPIFSKAYSLHGIKEKEKIENSLNVDDIINNHKPPDVYYKFFPTSSGMNNAFFVIMKKIYNSINDQGLFNTFKYGILKIYNKT